MFARLLHGAIALSLASEPAAAADAPETSESTADDPLEPEADAPAPEEAPPDEAVPEARAPEDDGAPEGTVPEDAASEDAAAADDAAAEEPEPEPEPGPLETPVATPPPSATEAPRPVLGPAPSGRNDDIVRKALLGGGVASLTLTAGLIGTSAWAWTEHNRAQRAIPNLVDQARVEAEDRRDQMRTIGAITTAAAALYGTTGVVLLLLNARDRKQNRRTVLAPTPRGLSLVGRF